MTATLTRSPRGAATDLVNAVKNPNLKTSSAFWTPTYFGAGGAGADSRETGLTWLAAMGFAPQAMKKQWGVAPTGAFNESGWQYTIDAWYASQTYTVSAHLLSPAHPITVFGYVRFYDASGNQLGPQISSDPVVAAANTFVRVWLTAQAPANTTAAVWGFGHAGTAMRPVTGDVLYAWGVARTAGTELTYYFDGDTVTGSYGAFAWEGAPGASYSDHIVPDWTTQFSPRLLLVSKSDRAVRNVLHDIVGRADPDVSLKPAGLRTGTLELLLFGDQAARAADLAFAGVGTWTLVDSDQPTRNMKFVLAPTGSLHLEQVEDDDNLWRLDVPFQELPA